MMHVEDAQAVLFRWIREEPHHRHSSYGYDIYLPNVIDWYLAEAGVSDAQERQRQITPLSRVFYAAAWELCRRGIIRPGVRERGLQSTEDGSAGDGYSVTPFGAQWARESDHDDFVPTEPQRFAQMLQPYGDQFGPGFMQRSQEAVRCYGAHAYLACCVLCGAAAESIILAAAVAKRGEKEALKKYRAAQGRGRVQSDLLAHATESVRREFSGLAVLLKYWRDVASHGQATRIDDNEAYTSLALLLRLAQFVREHWEELSRVPV